MAAPSSSSPYALPLHLLSIGDSIVVYQDGDRKWYPAKITEARGDHECEVLYRDGEREWLRLDKVKFILKRDRGGSSRPKRARFNATEEEEGSCGLEKIKDVLFDIGKVHTVSCRRSNRLKKTSTSEETSSPKNFTGELKYVEEPIPPCMVVPSVLCLTESKAGLDSTNSPPNKPKCGQDNDRIMFNHHGTSKFGDVPQSKIDEPINECSSRDSTTACTYLQSNDYLCSICQSGVARRFLVQCKNSGCSCAFHTFCLCPPLQTIEKEWPCPNCNGSSFSRNLTKGKKQVMKGIHKIVGRKKVAEEGQKNVFCDQFLVKWESLSHHHDSWVPREWLYIFDPMRMHSYLKKYSLMDGSDLIDGRKPEWFKIDRVIACRGKCGSDKSCEIWNICPGNIENSELEFLVKWTSLDYCDSTWESSCNEELLAEVGRLIQRHQRASERVNGSSISSGREEKIKTPNELYGGILYNFQLIGLNWILSNFKARRNVILADEMGLGKTVQVVSFICCMKQENLNINPVLVIAPKSILFQWEKEFRHWAKDLNVIIYQGEKESRRCIQTHEMYSSGKTVLFDALVTNYERVILDNSFLRKFKWAAIVIDEAHKIKRLDCKLASCLKLYDSDFRLLLTGTPLQNTLLELFALLHFIDPERFSDPEAEAESYESLKNLSLSNIEQKISEIHELLKPRMLRRMKSDVLPESIPVKKWVEVPCALTDSQRELYIDILDKNHEKLNKQIQSDRETDYQEELFEVADPETQEFVDPESLPTED